MLMLLARIILKLSYWLPLSAEHRAYVKTFLESVLTDQYELRKHLKKGDVVVDAGAFWGVFAWYASVRGGKVYAFEPSSTNFMKAKALLKKRKGVFLYQKAVGEKKKTAILRLYDKVPAANSLEDSGREIPVAGKEVVDVVSLDEELERLDFLKIDTEGYERNVLDGARGLIKKFRPVIAMSAYHNEGDKEELPRFLKSIEPSYECKLNRKLEEVLICTARDRGVI